MWCIFLTKVMNFIIFKGPSISQNATSKPVDCEELLRNGFNSSGVYTIWPRSRVTEDRPIQVFCDMDTDGGGWTVRHHNFLNIKQVIVEVSLL
ncbi:fibrinogen C-terminal domain-containing protein [Nephila pilipes]|uniref:Fibrinogen C-terminal domain-containing protein n=2 Tax=Nephila pilipes TaxID=299642 RepID=A0A8X6TFI3_NEPPI|nr:fibrinogen C-terminal domain-containing protein [Nephila pilipes]